MGRFSVNKRLLPLKLHFLLFSAGIASFAPYLPLHANQSGLSVTAIGILYFTVPVVAVITKPFFGWLADKYRKEKLIAVGMLLISIAFYLIISFIAPIQKEQHVAMTLKCENNRTEIMLDNSTSFSGCEKELTCKIVCTQCKNKKIVSNECEDSVEYGKYKVKKSIDEYFRVVNSSGIVCSMNYTGQCQLHCSCNEWSSNSEYHSITFWLFIICFLFVGTSERVLRSLTDAMCFDILKDRTKDFGKHRLWSTLGSCGAPFLAGYLLDITTYENKYNYSVAIYLSIAFMIADIFVTCKLCLGEREHVKKSTDICRDTLSFFSELKHVAFSIVTCIGGMMHGFDLVYYNIFMKEIGASKLLIGVSLAGGVIVEVPLLFFAGHVIKGIGHFNSLALSLLCTAIRFLCLVNIYNPLWVLLPQVILRPSLEFFSVTKSSYAKRWTPPGTDSTLQQVIGSIYGGAGVGIGYGLGGLAFDYYGSRHTYVITSIISVTSAIFCFAFAQYNGFQIRNMRKQAIKAGAIEISTIATKL